tara:strand:- start:1100 stop:2002 length:903 start_codon:yes stop_codon:yes gene_type:complete
MKVEIKYPNQEFFATVSEIDIKCISDDDFLKLEKVINSYGVTVIKDQKVNDEHQIEFSKKFGELEISIGTNTKKENNPYIKPQISRISNVDIRTNEMIPPNDHKVIFDRGNNVWHTDSSFKPIPAKFSILSAREIPEEGGGTEFIDACYALETWKNNNRKYSLEDIKEAITEHSIVYSRMQNTGDIFNDKFKTDMPFVKQRLVRTHPYTKRSAFYAGSHCSHIIGWDKDEGRNLINEINDWVINSGEIASHKWNSGEVVIWDNRRVQHRGTGFDESKYRRIMHRTTVAGDKPSYEEHVNI